jgi:hypothetical protein
MRALTLTVAVLVAACGPGGAVEGPDAGAGSFIAFSQDFEGFTLWTSSTIADAGPDPVHTAGPRTVYINALPPKGAAAFPKGTIIVKKMPFNTFAMVKRGGGYNAAGALDWEWFELVESNGSVAIKWRGLGPPAGEVYGKTGQTCNQCHAGATANDFVLTPALQLGSL